MDLATPLADLDAFLSNRHHQHRRGKYFRSTVQAQKSILKLQSVWPEMQGTQRLEAAAKSIGLVTRAAALWADMAGQGYFLRESAFALAVLAQLHRCLRFMAKRGLPDPASLPQAPQVLQLAALACADTVTLPSTDAKHDNVPEAEETAPAPKRPRKGSSSKGDGGAPQQHLSLLHSRQAGRSAAASGKASDSGPPVDALAGSLDFFGGLFSAASAQGGSSKPARKEKKKSKKKSKGKAKKRARE